jgi:hypothetical protein
MISSDASARLLIYVNKENQTQRGFIVQPQQSPAHVMQRSFDNVDLLKFHGFKYELELQSFRSSDLTNLRPG